MTSQDPVKTTALYDLHISLGAKMVPFAGYAMPVNYPDGIIKEHLHTRKHSGLFDVSHMGQIIVTGDDIAKQLETVLPIDILALEPGQQKYGLFLNDQGGVLDDLMVINRGDHFMLVVNAACKHDDLAYLQSKLGDSLNFKLLNDRALLALQGPQSAAALASLDGVDADDLATMKFMQVREMNLVGSVCIVSRSGYSGEDGFEISVPEDNAVNLANALLAHDAVNPIGLGARDSLRMEAGLCLYGQDMTPETTPIDAGLKWAISPVRRAERERAGGFPGADTILEQITNGADKKLVGLLPEGRAPMRTHTKLFDKDQNPIGEITSGGFSPSLGHPISMGYVNIDHATPGTELLAEVRGKFLPVGVATLPFVSHQFYR